MAKTMAELKAEAAAKAGGTSATVDTSKPQDVQTSEGDVSNFVDPALGGHAGETQGAGGDDMAKRLAEHAAGVAESMKERERLLKENAELRAKLDAYAAQHGRATEGASLATDTVHTAGVAMAGHVPARTEDIPTVDQINGTAG